MAACSTAAFGSHVLDVPSHEVLQQLDEMMSAPTDPSVNFVTPEFSTAEVEHPHEVVTADHAPTPADEEDVPVCCLILHVNRVFVYHSVCPCDLIMCPL